MAVKNYKMILFLILVTVSSSFSQVTELTDKCQRTECPHDQQCFLFNEGSQDESDPEAAICISREMRGKRIRPANAQVEYTIDCPPLKKIGLGGDKMDCGPTGDFQVCKDDLGCDSGKMCCETGCWTECVLPVKQRYPIVQ